MDKIDFRRKLPALYNPKAGPFHLVEVPAMRFVMIDGAGDPNSAPAYETAVGWLYAVSYAMKFAAKAALEQDYVVPPLEGLWSADDPAAFVRRDKQVWRWTMMIMVPDVVTDSMFEAAVTKASKKLGVPPVGLRLEAYAEGPSLQALHVGSYDDEGPVLAQLHADVMPRLGLTFNGPHHEIYLGDPRKTAAAKLKTILRQPVRKLAA